MREHPPIPVIDLADHIERLKANDGLRFSQEYEVSATHQSSIRLSLFLNDIDVTSRLGVTFVFMPLIQSNGLRFHPNFFSHFYTPITVPPENQQLHSILLFFFNKQAGGNFLTQSVCLDVSPKNVICRRFLRCTSVRDYLLSVFFHQKGGKFAFKVAHSGRCGDKSRPAEGRLL